MEPKLQVILAKKEISWLTMMDIRLPVSIFTDDNVQVGVYILYRLLPVTLEVIQGDFRDLDR
jgi:hypothetical protein